uniref:Myostatin 1 n=1 Tax=Helobdella sp. Austin TaxID=1071216 RepID=G1EH61_9ANNE|nr:myostatin 1 [Helobdella sp. Austin]
MALIPIKNVLLFTIFLMVFNNRSINVLIYSNLTKDCHNCLANGLVEIHKVEQIKKNILHKLNLTKAPNMSGLPIPDLPHLRDIIRDINRQAESRLVPRQASVSKLYRFSQDLPNQPPNTPLVFFNLTDVRLLVANDLSKCTLGLYVKKNSAGQARRSNIQVYDASTDRLLHNHSIGLADINKWVSLDVTELVKRWKSGASVNRGFKVVMSDDKGAGVALVSVKQSGDENYMPVLEMDIVKATHPRSKRSANTCNFDSQMCCTKELIVNFTEIGWNFVLAPNTFGSSLCLGNCPSITLPRPIIISSDNPVPQNCCTPSQYIPLTVMYFNSINSIRIETINGIVARECTCPVTPL